MEITKIKDGNSMTMMISGRIDTVTAPDLENEIKSDINELTDFVLDFQNVEYISSAGLRVLLSTQKTMNNQGKMIIKNVNDSVMEVFDVTGFVDILTIA